MKSKVFMAAIAVAFSFAVISCGNKKASDAEGAADSTAVEQVQACDSVEVCCKSDAVACDSAKACCKEAKECDKKECDKK